MASDPFTSSIVTSLAQKLNLPPNMAQAVVAFVLGKLLNHRMQAPAGQAPATRAQPGLHSVVQKVNQGQSVSSAEIHNAGLARELATDTGLSQDKAAAGVQEVLNMLGERTGGWA